MTCAESDHLGDCPVPRLDLRKGSLSEGALSLYLFIRDCADGDLVNFIDSILRRSDPGIAATNRATTMREALLAPLCEIRGGGRKIWSMVLADLLLAGDPARERWIATGASMIAIDGLVHNFLARTGIMDRCGVRHPKGPACYGPRGCAEVIATIARRIDARAYNPTFPAIFPRFVQAAIWSFCAQDRWSICAGTRIDDRHACQQALCPAFAACDRVVLRP